MRHASLKSVAITVTPETSLLLAKILCLYLVIVGIGMLVNRSYYQRTIDDFLLNPSTLLLSGFLSLIVGLLLINFHNLWVKDWRLIITIIGWLSFIKGIFRIIFPYEIQYLKGIIHNDIFFNFFGFVIIILGSLLGYVSFFNGEIVF